MILQVPARWRLRIDPWCCTRWLRLRHRFVAPHVGEIGVPGLTSRTSRCRFACWLGQGAPHEVTTLIQAGVGFHNSNMSKVRPYCARCLLVRPLPTHAPLP